MSGHDSPTLPDDPLQDLADASHLNRGIKRKVVCDAGNGVNGVEESSQLSAVAFQDTDANGFECQIQFLACEEQPPLKKARTADDHQWTRVATGDGEPHFKAPIQFSQPEIVNEESSRVGVSTSYVCAVTGARSEDVQACRVMCRDTPPDIIEQLEEIWGLQRHSLNLDDSSNLIQLTPTPARAFEAGTWTLIPSDRQLMRRLRDMEIGKNGVKDVFDVYAGKTVFTYKVAPLLGCTVDFGPGGDSPSTYVPPYKKLLQLDLPIFPHFFVINIATRFRMYNPIEEAEARSWMDQNDPTLIFRIMECEQLYPQWAPTREFDHEYAHLPRLDRFLNRLVYPRDSLSRVLSAMDEDGGEDADEDDEDAKCDSFSHAETNTQFRNRINIWIDGVRGAKVQCDPEHCPPETPTESYTDSPHARPLEGDTDLSYKNARAVEKQAHHTCDLDRVRTLETTPADPANAVPSSKLWTTNQTNVCAVTGLRSKDIQTCHVLPQDVAADEIERLEDIWGLERHSIDVNHSSNLLTLTPDLYQAFELGQWALVPSGMNLMSRLRRFELGYDGANTIFDIYDKAEEPMFTYNILPLPGCNVVFGSTNDTNAGRHPPYTTLPKLTLPIYPHLVLVDLVAKYTHISYREQRSLRRWMSNNGVLAYSVLECARIHERWALTLRARHEYDPLPPVDRALNRVLGPNDSYSEVLKRMAEDEGDGEEEEQERSNDFHATRTKGQVCKMVEGWLVGVRQAKAQVVAEHCSQETSELPPSPPSTVLGQLFQ